MGQIYIYFFLFLFWYKYIYIHNIANLISIGSLDLCGAGEVTGDQILESTLLNEISLHTVDKLMYDLQVVANSTGAKPNDTISRQIATLL